MCREALGRIVVGRPSVYLVRDVGVVSAIQIAASNLARPDERAVKLPNWLGDRSGGWYQDDPFGGLVTMRFTGL